MAQFVCFSPNLEVNGESIFIVMEGMGTFKRNAYRILEQHGLSNPELGKWYSKQAFLDAFRMIAEQLGPHTLFLIGKAVPSNSKFPPQLNDAHQALEAIDKAYHLNHRGGPIGSYQYQRLSEKEVRMVCENPYPCEFDRGLLDGVARKFHPGRSAALIVKHDDTQPCRKKGADSCTYIVKW